MLKFRRSATASSSSWPPCHPGLLLVILASSSSWPPPRHPGLLVILASSTPRSRSSGTYSVNPPQGDQGEEVARDGGRGEYTLLDRVGRRVWLVYPPLQESLSAANTPRSSFKDTVRNSLRKLKRGRKFKEEERDKRKKKEAVYEVTVEVNGDEQEEQEEGRVVVEHSSSRGRPSRRSKRSSLLTEITREVEDRRGGQEEGFKVFPEVHHGFSGNSLLPRCEPYHCHT